MKNLVYSGATKAKLLPGIIAVFILFFNYTISAQTLIVSITEPVSVAACDSNIFVAIFTTSDTLNLSIHVGLSDTSGTCAGPPYTNRLLLIIDPTTSASINGTFNANTGIWSGTIKGSGQTDTIIYRILIDCSVVPSLNAVSMDLVQTWTSPSSTITINNATNTLTQENIKYPFITLLPIMAFEANHLDTSFWSFNYFNSGTSEANIHIMFKAELECSIYDSLFTTWTIGGQTGNYQPGMAVTIPSGQALTLTQAVRMTGCIDNCNLGSVYFTWMCDTTFTSNLLECDSCQQIFENQFLIKKEQPLLSIIRIEPDTATQLYDNSCSEFVNWQMAIVNNSSGTTISYVEYLLENGVGSSLTLIDSASVNIICTSCTAIYDTTTAVICNDTVTTPLQKLTLKLIDFAPGDTAFISFSTYRCCTEDVSLLNVPKYFNHWIQKGKYQTICEDSLTTFNININPVYHGNSGISTNFITSPYHATGSDIDQVLQFNPSVTDLSVPQGTNPVFGDSVNFTVKLKKLFSDDYDKQVLGYSPYPDSSNTIMSGILRATIHCERGLRIKDLLDDVKLVTDSGEWAPVCYYTDVSVDSCQIGDYYLYYDLSTLYALNLDPDLFFTTGNFNFQLQACCEADTPAVPFTVTFHILMQNNTCYPSFDCSGFEQPNCSNCCWLPLSQVGHEIAVHCPGCVAPGIIVDYYFMRRTSFGLEDVNNNRIADTGANIIDYNSYSKKEELDISSSIHGDVLEDIMIAHFEPGSGPPDSGYVYTNYMDTAGAVLHVLQLDRKITMSDTMNLQVISFDFYIDVEDSLGGCIDCEKFDLDSMQYKTILKLSVDNGSLATYLEHLEPLQDSIQYFYSFIDAVILADTLNIKYTDSSFTGYREEQQYRLAVKYDVCGNFSAPYQGFITTELKKNARITNKMWLNGIKQPFNNSLLQMPMSMSALSAAGLLPIQPAFADSFLFFCETFGGMHFFYSTDYINETAYQNLAADSFCANNVKITSLATIAKNALGDVFPYEVRIPPMAPSQYMQTIPQGFVLNNPTATWSSLVYNSGILEDSNPLTFNLPQPDINGTFSFNSDTVAAIHCRTEADSVLTGAYSDDQFSYHVINYYINPDQCDSSFTATVPEDHSVMVYRSSSSACDTVSLHCVITDSLLNQIAIEQRQIGIPNPTLSLNITPNNNINTTHICWEFEFINGNQQNAQNAFIAVPDTSEVNYLTNWIITYNNTLDTIFPVNNIFYISGNLETLFSGNICADIIDCETDTVPFYFGWGCSGSTDSLAEACMLDTTSTLFATNSIVIDPVNLLAPATFDLCSPFTISSCFTNLNNGEAYPLSVQINSPAPGINIDTVKLFSCHNGTMTNDWIVLTSTAPGIWDLPADSVLGLTDCLCIEAILTAGCTYSTAPIVLPDIVLNLQTYCMDSIIATADFNHTLQYVGNNCTDCFSISKTVNTHPVYQDSLVEYSITVCNDNDTSQNVTLVDLIPAGFTVDTTNIPNGTFSLDTGCTSYFVIGHFATINNCPNTYNTAVLTFNSGALSIADSICVEVLDGCFALADSGYIFTDTTYTSLLPYDTIFQQDVYIGGVFIVDENFMFRNSTVYMGIGAQIIIDQDDTLTITEGSTLLGCTTMWRGIHLDPFGAVRILSSTIIDAANAVYASHRSYFELDAASILDCVNGVYAPPNAGGGFVPTVGIVLRSRFAGTFSFKPPYPGQSLTPGILPKVGIDVSHVILNIGDNNYPYPNEFVNMNMGIIGRNSHLRIKNSKFENIYPDAYYPNPHLNNGSAIASFANMSPYGYLSVEYTYNQSLAPMITNTYNGIHVLAGSSDISNVNMYNVGNGISARGNNYGLYTNLLTNTIYAYRYGLHLQSNTGSSLVKVVGNNIKVKGKATGIYMAERRNTAPANYSITYNSIKVDSADVGIDMYNVNRPVIAENTISLIPRINGNGEAFGIKVNGCRQSLVSCNDIRGNFTGSISNITKGIFVGESDTSQITCNIVDSTYQGIRFHGLDFATALRGNDFYYNFEGLYLETTAIIDKQVHHGNKWHVTAPQGGFGAINWNTAAGMDTSQFIILTTQVNTIFEPSYPINFNNGWFDVDIGTTFDCNGISATPTGPTSPVCATYDTEYVFEGSIDLKLAIATEMLETVDWNEESQAKARQYLYNLLIQDSTLAVSRSEFIEFMELYETYLHTEYKVNNELRNIEQYDSLFTSLIAEADSLILVYSDSIEYIFKRGLTEEYADTLDMLYYQINFLEQTKGNLISQRQAMTEAELGEIVHDYIVSPELPHINTQYINRVYSDYLESGENDKILDVEYNNLLALANQCPAAGGQSVYRARAMLALLNDSIEYNDAIVCLQSGIYRENYSELMTPKFKLVPNPTQNLVELIVEKNNPEICRVEIINILGAELVRKNIDCNQKSHYIDVSVLNNGIYLVKFFINDEAVDAQKLVIMK